jgi:hypothetical protein
VSCVSTCCHRECGLDTEGMREREHQNIGTSTSGLGSGAEPCSSQDQTVQVRRPRLSATIPGNKDDRTILKYVSSQCIS